MNSALNNTTLSSGRIKFIDGLRAIAVLMVVLFHFYYQQTADAGNTLVSPGVLQEIFQYGNMGVYIFFVISGFIVSYVTHNRVSSGKFILSFIIKRQVRLDPPFWLAVFLGVLLAFVSVSVLHTNVYVPTGMDILFNMIYLFDIFDRYDIIRVGWTLCLEIQFYLVFILLVFFLNKFCRSNTIKLIVYLMLFVLSMATYWLLPVTLNDYIVNYWFVFFLGVSITLLLHREINTTVFFFILLLPFLLTFTDANLIPIYFSGATAFFIYLAFRLNRQHTWLSSRFFQFFGVISYSLYLTHCLIGNKIIRLLKSRLHWEPQDIMLTAGILLFSMAISTIFAYLFYRVIEKRSVAWSRTISSLIK